MRHHICIITSIHPDFDARITKQARSLAGYGYKVDLVCPWNCHDANTPGTNFLTFKRANRRLTRFLNYFRIGKCLHKKPYDLYHFHDIDILPLFCLVKFLAKKPVIYDVHENYPEQMLVKFWVPRYLRPILSFLVKHAQRVCAYYIRNLIIVVPLQEAEFKASRYKKVMVRNFPSTDLLKGKQNDYESRPDTIIFTGKQNINNGSLLLLEIAEKVLKKHPRVQFLAIDFFAGNDALKKDMLDYIKDHSLQKKFAFLPFRRAHEIMKYLNKATIAISPNLKVPQQIMGIHTKLFEYMTGGLPIVASKLPHQAEVISKANCGFLADPDSIDEFVDRICFLISNRSEAKQMGENGVRAFLEHYSWEIEVTKLRKMYDVLLN
ncbi:MAG: glycosyltransferase family 4 protein [Desulfobacterales bacterium]|nr:glycosyltransferase family 4 protein [Desulfobacterales bacterium]